jgi:RimJ/RimL family protein N-acetyltransferase
LAIPTLTTPRLIIQEFTDADREGRRLLIEDAFGEPVSQADNDQWMQWTLLNYRALERLYQPPYGDYAIRDRQSAALIGSIGLVPSVVPWGVFPQFRDTGASQLALTPEFGLFWAVASPFRGQGYATEAAAAFSRHLFSAVNIKRLVATTERHNFESQRVMHKLGMALYENPTSEPHWFEVVGLLKQPG